MMGEKRYEQVYILGDSMIVMGVLYVAAKPLTHTASGQADSWD